MTTIGGQALIEGVMMKGPTDIAIAVRKPNNEIEVKKEKLNTSSSRHKFLRLPIIRGVVGLIDAMVIGTKSLMYSAEFYDEEYDKSKIEEYVEKKYDNKEKVQKVEMFLTLLLSLAIVIVVFMMVPMFLTNLFKKAIESHNRNKNYQFWQYGNHVEEIYTLHLCGIS